MASTQPQLIAMAADTPVRGDKATPFSHQTVVLTKQDYIALKWEANYWRAQHARLVQREAALKAQVEALEAQIRDLTQRLYGTKSEKSAASEGAARSMRSSRASGVNNRARRDTAAVIVPLCQWWWKYTT